jgi:hypothetical protein
MVSFSVDPVSSCPERENLMSDRLFARAVGGACAAVLLLAVPLLAAWAVTPGAKDVGTVIAASDDVVANGFQIVDAPSDVTRHEVRSEVASAPPVETVLRHWVYTRFPNPSPGH